MSLEYEIQISLAEPASDQWLHFTEAQRAHLHEQFSRLLSTAHDALLGADPDTSAIFSEVEDLRLQVAATRAGVIGGFFPFALSSDFSVDLALTLEPKHCLLTIRQFVRTKTLGAALETTAAMEAAGTVQASSHQPRAARRATALAVRLAGEQRGYLDRDWAAVLAGSPEDGIRHSARQQLALALGFFIAALRMRVGDLARPIWRPIDWLLRVQSRTNTFITSVVGAQAVWIVDDGGLAALVTEVWEPCGGAALALYALSRWLRRIRGIELSEIGPESGGR
ncbi:hypothetical protein [Streptomyces sp. NPDC059759]|uniref:hypothetical protein n=1 Tax=Streptomyces sp. NPDC059759 TaxID=3346936 RepID=UPI003646762A